MLKAEEDIKLSDALGIRESRSLNPEAYRAEELLSLGLNFTSEAAASFSLEQNTPNPFRTSSQIGFTLTQEEDITFSVQNVQGQVIYQIQGKYAAGEHLVALNRQLLGNAQGVLSYTLSTADASLTKKMVLLP
ncbi:T9SS type A sorting domain-containing protein [Lewinella cohaerens]|uniref:T9SS type A sorting domain-containing protein n=1 Tax=Lewinella cohaerens TaxID=70995 RepID=UPI003CCC0EFE